MEDSDHSVHIFFHIHWENIPCHNAQIISYWFLEHDNESSDLNPVEQQNHIHNTHCTVYMMHHVPSSWNLENLSIRQNPLCKLDCSFKATFKAYSYSYLISSIQATLMPTYLKALTRHSEVLLERLNLFFKCQSEGDVPWGGGYQYIYVFSINKGLSCLHPP